METVNPILAFEKMYTWPRLFSNNKRPQKGKKPSRSGSSQNFSRLSALAEDTHRNLVESDSNLRVCVHSDDSKIHMDIITLDQDRRMDQHYSKDITGDNPLNLVRRLHAKTGLICDYKL